MTIGITAILAVYQVVALIHYVEKTEKDLIRFLQAIKYEDFYESFSGGRSRIAKLLHEEFNRIIQDFRKVRAQREEQYLYLQTIVQHVGIALLTYDDNGEVELFNSTFRRLFKIPHIMNIKRLEIVSSDLYNTLIEIRSSESRQVRVMAHGELMLLSIHATEFRRQGTNYKLVSIQDIRSELEEKELEAWQNLIRVLTHEIRNSITPITSLASTTDTLLSDVDSIDPEVKDQLDDAKLAISTIRNRSKGLLRFVEAFRSLYKIPDPIFSKVSVSELLTHIHQMFEKRVEDKNIICDFNCRPAALDIMVDEDLISQVLINLITNAIDSLDETGEGRIWVEARMDQRGRPIIAITDNGRGIEKELTEKIFIPFFTTKKEGSGIGLSLSRQIMRQHKGSIVVESIPGEKTTFFLEF